MDISNRADILTLLRFVAVAATLLVCPSVYASDIRERVIAPVCLWELAENGGTVMACARGHGSIPVKIEDGVITSPMADESEPNNPDEIRATRLGRLRNGDEVFLITSMRYGEKEGGTKVVIWRVTSPDGGKVEVIATSGYRLQGGIAAAFPLADQRIQVDVTFDTAWNGINRNWEGLPDRFWKSSGFGVGCPFCGMGVAHVLYPSDGNGRPVLKSIEFDKVPEGNRCRGKQLLAMAGSLPHTFEPQQFHELIGALKTCPDEDTTN